MNSFPLRRLLASALLSVLSGEASAIGLIQAYQDALQNDPAYRSAWFENEAGQENRAIGRSSLMPNLSMSYASNRNFLNVTTITSQGNFSTQPDYNGMVSALTLRQPLFNLGDLARYNEGVAQAEYSRAQFNGRGQELVIKLVSAYTDVLYAEDQLVLGNAQRDAFEEQKLVNERMMQKGEGTRTDELETESKYAMALVHVIEAQDGVTAAKLALSAIVGEDVGDVNHLTDDFRTRPLEPATFAEWKELALANNPDLAAQSYAVEASRQEMKKNRAGHAPQLDFVASISKNNAGSIYTYNQDMTVRSYGIEFNMPLFAGGYVNATTRQANANYERAKADLSDKTNKALIELQKQYVLVQSSSARVNALTKAVDAARLLVVATRESIKGGVRVNLDLLNAQQQFFQSRRDLAQARYNYLLSYLKLKQASGTLAADDLQGVAKYFTLGVSAH